MSTITSLSSEQLRRAADLKEKISAMEAELAAMLGGAPVAVQSAPAPVEIPAPNRKKGKISAEGIARIKAAQKLRWAKHHKETATAKPVRVKKFTMSATAKAKISAAAKARWARFHAAKEA